tara:strand:+ start:2035 stop:3204 length:1170 start_codon:yes stop_codon:yes gene_type:complete
MRKICVISGTRAEYGLLYWVMKSIENDPDLKLQLIVTGMHLSPEFGLTYKQIENDGFVIDKKLEILLSSDTPVGISKSIGLANISFSEIYDELKPDIILVLGDRFEIFAASVSAMVSKIPIAHCHGGEATLGLIDESIRHSITKMSHFHFTSTDQYRNRVIQLGEIPENVHNVGALGVENINKLNLLDKNKLESELNFKLNGRLNILVTFHPVTLEQNSSKKQILALLEAIDMLENIKVIFTKSNADTDGRIINQMIEEYVKKNKNCRCYSSLGQLKYLSAIKHCDIVIGNSSSGIIEAPSFKKPTINIGDRQENRIKADSVIDCEPRKEEIYNAIIKSQTKDFMKKLSKMNSPYGNGNSSEKIMKIIKSIDYSNKESILKKPFYDLNT